MACDSSASSASETACRKVLDAQAELVAEYRLEVVREARSALEEADEPTTSELLSSIRAYEQFLSGRRTGSDAFAEHGALLRDIFSKCQIE